MGTKNNPDEFDCYANAEPDEPMFILLGRDKQASKFVREWALERLAAIGRGEKPIQHVYKAIKALQCAADMEAWEAETPLRKSAAEDVKRLAEQVAPMVGPMYDETTVVALAPNELWIRKDASFGYDDHAATAAELLSATTIRNRR